ncbi:GNAT family N-acetyltransferase [Epibacterium sp. SM1979]|uniref:GNAT family N-acetyltransferase n=1 Tax=Tritonibacter litoralis TaxID=2662264 RepID=A0A843YDT3_9RHOB|nr:GNAT family N-acetyltransferase [Tritonibacter litoralis]MQQ08018.1 GNAT family N-acetyltransferase [Tritonibacter litoralis]
MDGLVNLEIRAAAAKDYTQILEWHRQTNAEHKELRPSVFASGAASDISEKKLRKLFRHPLGTRKKCDDILVAYVEDTLIGYIWCNIARNRMGRPDLSRSASIYDVFVVKAARRNGVGRKLLQAAQEHTHAVGIPKMHAIAWGGNTASQALFENQWNETLRFFEVELSEPPAKKKKDWLFTIALIFIAAWGAAALLSRGS